MAFFDNIKGKVTQASQTTVQKAKDLSEIAKLNTAVSNAEKQIFTIYGQIGMEIYKAYADNPQPEVAELVEQVKALEAAIQESKDRIKTLSAGEVCPECGAKISKGMVFCSTCGAKLPVPEVPAAPEAPAAKVCANCGEALEPDSLFCTACGTKVE